MTEVEEVEKTLRLQKEAWRTISQNVAHSFSQSLPPSFPKRIILFGVGSSLHAAKLTAYSLIRASNRPRVPIYACSSMDIGVGIFPKPGDWAFAFSHRGKTEVTLQAIERCNKLNAFTLLVTSEGAHSRSKARLVLPTSPLEKCEPHTLGLTGPICGVTSLLVGNRAVEGWLALSEEKDPDLEVLKSKVTPPSLLLGEWEGEWIAFEISLKLMEMAKVRSRPFGTEQFFHGPQMTLRPDEKIWYVALPGDRRADQVKASFVTQVRQKIFLDWVSSLVELQWLCLAVSLNGQRT